jgi:hypothetical protein
VATYIMRPRQTLARPEMRGKTRPVALATTSILYRSEPPTAMTALPVSVVVAR